LKAERTAKEFRGRWGQTLRKHPCQRKSNTKLDGAIVIAPAFTGLVMPNKNRRDS
jgi:hypothetical protein